jgi:hypothetical protein
VQLAGIREQSAKPAARGEATASCLPALCTLPPARSLSLFRRSGRIARIVRHEKPSPQATIELLDEAGAYGVLMRAADWVRAGDGGELAVPPALHGPCEGRARSRQAGRAGV